MRDLMDAITWWLPQQGEFTLHAVEQRGEGVFVMVTQEGIPEPQEIRLPDNLVELYREREE